MPKPTRAELEPVFGSYGLAVYAAQSLERAIRLLLAIKAHVTPDGREKSDFVSLDQPNGPKTLGKLFGTLLTVEFVSDDDRRYIWDAIKTRNALVHGYWAAKQTLAMTTRKGRRWLVRDLHDKYKLCRHADALISSIIDQYLAAYETSIEDMGASTLEEIWENDTEPPADVLH